jgi:8-oxo-dGTP pyrophosphatase MutT (NUDIX family)
MAIDPSMKFSGQYDESKTPLPVGVGALMLRASGEVCAISRKTNTFDLGLPGGKVDSGETEAQALKRELWEELGIRIRKYHRVFATVDSGGYWFVTFLVYDWEGEPFDHEKKGAVVRWVLPLRLIQPDCSFRDYNRDLFIYLGMMYEGSP